MDVKRNFLEQHEGFVKMEVDFVIEQTEENHLYFNKPQMCKIKQEHDMVDGEVKIVECLATGQYANEKINQHIVCQEPKITQQSNLSATTDHDWMKISTNIKQEFEDCEVKADDMLTGIIDIKKELEYSKLKIETELLSTHCDLPTLKDEIIDDLDCLEQPCSNKQVNRKSKPLNHNATHFSKYKKKYPRLVCQKSADLEKKQMVSSKLRETRDHPRICNKKKHKCIYCNLPVGNFARHLQRHHADELEVQNIMVLPKLDKRRKEMLNKIRKKGVVCSDNVTPVQGKETATNDACTLPYNLRSENRPSNVLQSSGSDCEPDIIGSSLTSNTSDPGSIEIQGFDSNLLEDIIMNKDLDNNPLDDVLIDQTNFVDWMKEQGNNSNSPTMDDINVKVNNSNSPTTDDINVKVNNTNSPTMDDINVKVNNSNSPTTDIATAVVHNDEVINLPTPSKKTFNLRKRTFKRRKHNCMYCDVTVDNFARHLERQHTDELEVQNFLQLPKWDKNRKEMIDKIRKEGDFCSGNVVPVQSRKTPTDDPCSKLPCIFCSGYYSRKTLSKHIKRCPLNKKKNSYKRHCQSGHTYMANNFRPNDVLRISGVLDSLKADEISLVAKRDKIICEVGRKYIKYHKDGHLVAIAKRYMRRLARLLIEIRRIENDVSLTIINILHPSKFNTIVQALKAISQYDEVRKTFKFPSLALQMKNLLKKAISAAYYLEIQSNKNSPLLKIFDKMTDLINEEWATKVSTEECQNLNVNRSPIIPLTQDLQKMKLYLDDLISNAKINLQENNKNEYAYKTLIEGTYCNLLLFNKRREGELQKIMLDTYTTHSNSTIEFEKLLSPSERILVNKLKRIVIKGKNERRVLVLIDKSTQEGIDVAVKHRSNFFGTPNPYLFGSCHTKNSINGFNIFRKHAKNALNDPNKVSSLSSIKFRKHLATISQILKMDRDDLKQLAKFMGHTAKENSEWYKLPSDINQTAKVSKILLLAQDRSIKKFKGRNLNDIQLDPTIIETRLDSDDEQEDINIENENKSPLKIEKKKITRISWTKQEKELTKKHFRKHIQKKIPPKKDEVQNFVELYPETFSRRKWDVIKAYVCNQYNKK